MGVAVHRRARALFALVLAGALALAACGDDPSGGTASATGSTLVDATTDTSVDDTDDDAGDETGDEAGDATDPGCLVGTWTVTPDEIVAYYAELLVSTPEVTVRSASAPYTLVFTADAYEWLPAGTLAMDAIGQDATAEVGGSIRGSYVADGGAITTSLTEPGITITVTVGGSTFDGSEMGAGFLSAAPIADSTFECGPNALAIHTDAGGVTGTLDLIRS